MGDSCSAGYRHIAVGGSAVVDGEEEGIGRCEVNGVAPLADAIHRAAVGAHFGGVGLLRCETGEGVGVGGDGNEVCLVIIDADLPL